ncbi:MAG: 23S rRNA (adenine(2503)-C(2))-methyltransferase RlmN [Pseudomonadales bacterium]
MELKASQEKVNLLGLTPAALREFVVGLGQKPFRATQLLKWMHHQGVADFSAMTDISKTLRERLGEQAEIRAPKVVSELKSKDGTRKWIIRVDGGSCVETVMIPEQGRRTLCVSSQVGCTLDCSFCATGKQGFQRNLSSAEIIGQLWIASKALVEPGEPVNRAISNVVMMGMGEPLLNFDNLTASLQLMMHDLAYGISKRRVTVSTSGVVPAIDELSKVSDASLAISLHAPDNALRDVLVPINRKYPIAELLAACRRYLQSLPDRKRVITVEYTLIKGVNDSLQQAQQTAELLCDFPCKINLIPFNPFFLSDYQRPSGNAVSRFRDTLQRKGHTVTIRSTRGEDIDAACGQLAGSVADRTGRSERHRLNDPLQPNTIAIAG